MDLEDADSGESEDMDVSVGEAGRHRAAQLTGRGSDSPLFEVPEDIAGPHGHVMASENLVKMHLRGLKGPKAPDPRSSIPAFEALPPGLAGDSPRQTWVQQSGPRSQTSSPGSDLPPGLGPDDMMLAASIQAPPHHVGKSQHMPEVVDIPGIGTIASEHLRELSRSPILTSLFPQSGGAQNQSTGNLSALIQHHRVSTSSITSTTTNSNRSVSPIDAGFGELQHSDLQNGEVHRSQLSHANGNYSRSEPGKLNAAQNGLQSGFQSGLSPFHPGAVPTQPVSNGIQASAAAATHGSSHAADGAWTFSHLGHDPGPASQQQLQGVEPSSSWPSPEATPAEAQLAAAAPVRPPSDLGRPIQDLSLLGDQANVLLQ